MEYRDFGRTGLKVSIVGFGGIVVSGEPQDVADRVVADAIDRGVNYFDFSPTYGNSEELLGPALRGRRDGVVLACKTTDRTRNGAAAELHRSLGRLETDHFDIYQLHGVPTIEELNTALGPGGAIETMVDAKQKGLTRAIGITCHTPDVALEAMRRFDFDSILFPVNYVCWFERGVGPEALSEASKKGMGRAAIKSMARRRWSENAERRWEKVWYEPIDDPAEAELAVRFTLSQDVHVMIPPGQLELFQIGLTAAERFRPLDEGEEARLREVAKGMEAIF